MADGKLRRELACTMCFDTLQCPECDSDEPDLDCAWCGGSGECPECMDEPAPTDD